jgi:YD repeat-containing protein
LTPKQSHHNRSYQSLSIKQASSPGKTCASSYEKNSISSLNQQLAVSYQFDASGNRVQVSNAPVGGAAAEIGTYSYDASGRMLSGRDDKRNEVVSSLAYDGFGNRISETRTGGPTPFTSYSYDANNRVLSSSAGEQWAYDANGNTTSQTSRDGSTSSTAFNAENRSTSSSSTSEGKTTTSSSTYDAAGNVTSSRVDGDGFGFTEVTQRDIRYQEVRKDITQSWAKGAARLEGATSFSYDANGNLAFLDRGRKQGAGQNSVAYFDYDLEGQIIGRADKASALTNAAFFAGYAVDPDAVAASGDGESGFSYFNPSQTQQVQRQLFGSQFTSSASTGLQNYLYANNKPISQAAGNQTLALKKLTLQGGQPIQAPIDPVTGEPAASTGSRLLIEESDIARTAGVIDRTATARNIAARAYAGDPGFAQLSLAAQDKVAAYVLAQLPPDAEIVAGAQVTLHSFILMVDASYTGLSQITDYSLRQLGSDGIPGGTVQSHVVRAGDTLQTIAQIYFGSPAYWYLIADANGLSGSEALTEGLTLTIPNQVANSANSAQTFKVYNESEVIGSTSPEIRTVAKKKKWYQKLIQILIIVILVIA